MAHIFLSSLLKHQHGSLGRGASKDGLLPEPSAEGPPVDPVLDASGENLRIQLKTFLFHFFKFLLSLKFCIGSGTLRRNEGLTLLSLHVCEFLL